MNGETVLAGDFYQHMGTGEHIIIQKDAAVEGHSFDFRGGPIFRYTEKIDRAEYRKVIRGLVAKVQRLEKIEKDRDYWEKEWMKIDRNVEDFFRHLRVQRMKEYLPMLRLYRSLSTGIPDNFP